MFSSGSSSDDDGGDRAASRGTMRSIFESDRRAAKASGTSLKYEAPKKDKLTEAATGSTRVEPGSAPPPGAGSTSAAASAPVIVYRGDQQLGPGMIAVTVSPQACNIIIIDRERRALAKIRIDESLQLLPSADEPVYATLYDPIVQIHWMLLFKGAAEAAGFVAAALTVQHYLLLPEGPRSPVIDLIEGAVDEFGRPKPAKKGDDVLVSLLTWKLKRLGQVFSTDKLVDEIAVEAPRKVEIGDGALMLGVEDALVGCRPGAWRIIIVNPKKTRTSGLGNPEIGPKDTVVAFVRLHSIERGAEEEHFPEEDPDHPPPKSTLAIEGRKGQKAASPEPERTPEPAGGGGGGAAGFASPASREEDSILKALLMQTVQMQQQQQATFQFLASQNTQHPPPPPPPKPDTDAPVPAHVERSLDRINQQLSALYEKIDRLDFEKRLEQNNEKMERMMKKAVGKMPVNDVDVEDMAKDKDQLLARIEALKERLDQMTDQYHQALHEYGEMKERLTAAVNDLSIERSTNEKSLIDLKERHRLQLVEAEVRLRNAVDDTREKAYAEGKEAGYEEGYNVGKVDAMTGDSKDESVERLKAILSAKEQELINLQSRNSELERRSFEDRRLGTEEKAALQGLIERLEQKERLRQGVVYDQATAVAKMIRRVMNATYASFEEQLYATESDSVPVQDALNMALVAVKSEARAATEELKREAASRATEPAHEAEANEAVRESASELGEPVPRAPPTTSAIAAASGYESATSAVSHPRSSASAQDAVAAYSHAAASHYDPTADTDDESRGQVRYGTGTVAETGYESTASGGTGSIGAVGAISSAVAAATFATELDRPPLPDGADDVIAEARATKPLGAMPSGDLAAAYAMPTDGDADDAEYANEDEIAAYLAGRGAADDEVGAHEVAE